MRSRQLGISPAKIAIAVAVTMAAIAGTGAMKNVTGTSSAVAIVAVNPGTAPTNKPNSEAPSMTTMLYGSNTIANACDQAGLMMSSLPGKRLQHAPRQGHLEQLIKAVMNAQRQDDRKRQYQHQAHAQDPHQCGEINRAGDDEAETIDG